MVLDRETVLKQLRELSSSIADLEVVLDPMRVKRDKLILHALEIGVTEWPIARASGKSRAWIWSLKKRNGVKTQKKYNKKYSTGAKRRADESRDSGS